MDRKLIVFRHGERVDFSFGENWLSTCFTPDGTFSQNPALDLPASNLLRRQGMPESYRNDCPLTRTGVEEGRNAGKLLVDSKYLNLTKGLDVYVSSSLRSIQTAAAIIEGVKEATKKFEDNSIKPSSIIMKVEPCLFEWAGFYASHKRAPQFAIVDELLEANYKVDPNYEPFLKAEALDVGERVDQYYGRSYHFVQSILNQSENDILLVGHSATPDVATRQLCGKPPLKNVQEMLEELWHVPYAGFAVAEHKMVAQDLTPQWVITKQP